MTTFEDISIFEAALGSNKKWLEHKIKQSFKLNLFNRQL
jgi:hypothetical protein